MTDNLAPAIRLATELREKDMRVQLYSEPKKFKAKMSYAAKLGVPYVVFLGDDEIAAGTCSVKDMFTGEQVTVSLAEAGELISKGLVEKNNGFVIVE